MKLGKLSFMIPLLLIATVVGFAITQAQSFQRRQNQISREGIIVGVSDGDTLTINLDGKDIKTRLCGVDAPELRQALGREAKALLEKLVLDKEVLVTQVNHDPYGRMVAEVFVTETSDEKFVNADLVGAGLAYLDDRYSDKCPNGGVIAQAEAIAQDKNIGVWANPGSMKPWDYRRAQ